MRLAHWSVTFVVLLCVGLSGAEMTRAQATRPAGADISPEASAVLDQLRNAYAGLQSLRLAGTYKLELDAAGAQMQRQASFESSFLAPNRFKHEMSDDALLVGTGPKAYLYVDQSDKYAESVSPEDRADDAGLEEPLGRVLRAQNLSLYLSLSSDAAAELLEDAERVELEDGQGEGPVLRITYPDQRAEVVIDAATHLVRQVRVDLAPMLEEKGLPDVKRAVITIDYTKVEPGAAIAEETFAWTPPADATLAKQHTAALAGGEPDSLVGRRAPAFALEDLDGNTIELSSLRGQVVVLDFWATWCGPCGAAMPHLQKIQDEFADKGVKVLAIDLKEDEETVRKYLTSADLKLTVLLDTKGTVAGEYLVKGIPQTVVIGRDGKVAQVFVGFGPDSERRLREAIEKASAVP